MKLVEKSGCSALPTSTDGCPPLLSCDSGAKTHRKKEIRPSVEKTRGEEKGDDNPPLSTSALRGAF
jgi:hypothetical protein